MPIRQSDLRNASQRGLLFTKRVGQLTAFLSHSHKDAQLALGLQALLNDQGCNVYIDWQDHTMPDKPDIQTALNIKLAIVRSDWLLFLATQHSMTSRWCPWEIGFADGKKNNGRIAIIPTQDDKGSFYGNEYLSLYNKIDVSSVHTGFAFFDTRGNSKSIRNL